MDGQKGSETGVFGEQMFRKWGMKTF
jgi:hypothetical protein